MNSVVTMADLGLSFEGGNSVKKHFGIYKAAVAEHFVQIPPTSALLVGCSSELSLNAFNDLLPQVERMMVLDLEDRTIDAGNIDWIIGDILEDDAMKLPQSDVVMTNFLLHNLVSDGQKVSIDHIFRAVQNIIALCKPGGLVILVEDITFQPVGVQLYPQLISFLMNEGYNVLANTNLEAMESYDIGVYQLNIYP